MFRQVVSIALSFTAALILAPPALAQVASLHGKILGTDGRPLKSAELRVEGKDKSIAPFTTVTGTNGQYLIAALPAGVYRLSILGGGAEKLSVDVKMRGEKARIDFDLSPSAAKKIRNYVWVGGRTGSNLAGRWAERDAGITRPNR
jgi:hypothetical protein